MTVDPQLIGGARTFAEEVGLLLNRTVTDGLRLSVVFDEARNECKIGKGITSRDLTGTAIPLCFQGRAPSCYLYVSHRLHMDVEGMYLADAKSAYVLYRDQAIEQPLLRYEYHRNNAHHPEAHIHFHGEFSYGCPPGVRPPRKLHLPVGGRRFRPSLEDLVEFLILEGFCEGREGWQEAVDEHRSFWFERQLKAAVRRHPDLVSDQMRDMGFEVHAPA